MSLSGSKHRAAERKPSGHRLNPTWAVEPSKIRGFIERRNQPGIPAAMQWSTGFPTCHDFNHRRQRPTSPVRPAVEKRCYLEEGLPNGAVDGSGVAVHPTEAMSSLILLFARVPAPGHGKSRLAATMGAEAAHRIADYLLRRTLETCFPAFPVHIWYTPAEGERAVQGWLRPGWSCSAQGGGDLGERLAQAFQEAFAGGFSRVLAIGCDCPEMTTKDLQDAEHALEQSEVVLGPARDGGYWLLGMRRFYPELLSEIPWSTDAVFQRTLERAAGAGLSVSLLRRLSDIDTESDWIEFLAVNPSINLPLQVKTELPKVLIH